MKLPSVARLTVPPRVVAPFVIATAVGVVPSGSKSLTRTPLAALTVMRVLPMPFGYASGRATGALMTEPGTSVRLPPFWLRSSVKVTPVASVPLLVIVTVYISVSPGSALPLLLLSTCSASARVAVMTGANGLATPAAAFLARNAGSNRLPRPGCRAIPNPATAIGMRFALMPLIAGVPTVCRTGFVVVVRVACDGSASIVTAATSATGPM